MTKEKQKKTFKEKVKRASIKIYKWGYKFMLKEILFRLHSFFYFFYKRFANHLDAV